MRYSTTLLAVTLLTACGDPSEHEKLCEETRLAEAVRVCKEIGGTFGVSPFGNFYCAGEPPPACACEGD